jgi:hypothetical protein
MDWSRLLAYITGTFDQELLLRNEYLAAENRILKAQITTRLQLSDAERATLAEIGHRLGFAFGGALLDPLALAGSPPIKRLQPLVGETRSKKGHSPSPPRK